MAENRHYGREVATTCILTAAVCVALILLGKNYFILRYQITQEQIYTLCSRLFPLVIGLIMVLAGVMTAHRKEDEREDRADWLPPNAYDAPLYRDPKDDPVSLNYSEMAYTQQPVPQKVEKVVQTKVPVVEKSFPSILGEELESAAKYDYDLTLAISPISKAEGEQLASLIGDNAFYFPLDDGSAYIFPFYNVEEAKAVTAEACGDKSIEIGYSSRNGRDVTTQTLEREARLALS